jgi:DNA-nicking Smr family endonuclease
VAAKEDRSLFRAAVRDVHPLNDKARTDNSKHPPPAVPTRSTPGEAAVLRQNPIASGDAESFLRPGLKRDALRRLRRGHWPVEDEIDLHGLTSTQARETIASFLASCVRRGRRCVRVVHGKGLRSPNREPVLKNRLRGWLPLHEEVLAFCEAPSSAGGTGAMLVLLRSA